MADTSAPAASNEKKRKRPRAARACELCRAKKYRCDELLPCSQCKRQKVECVYDVADHVRQRMFQPGTIETSDSDTAKRDNPAPSATGGVYLPSPRELSSTAGSHDITTPQSPSPIPGRWNQANTHSQSNTARLDRLGSRTSTSQVDDEHDVEVSDINPHTQNVEFHGQTSSIAFLAALQPSSLHDKSSDDNPAARPHKSSLVSLFHNNAFSPEALANTQQQDPIGLEHERYYFRQAQIFLDGYFQNVHFIHPILDRQAFMKRCEDLWFGKPERQPKCFVALYYSIMSLGALIKTWDEDKFDGLGRLEWSRKFFNLTRTAVGGLASMTAVESIQCLFFMAKVSQNELNPSLAYLYLGWATRAAFSAGFNRRQRQTTDETDGSSSEIARLWWGLYSLEVEISFSLGRPDSLGADAYHNQLMPVLEESETAIITVMVHFARHVREVSISIYLASGTIHEKTIAAARIESNMDAWLENIPDIIKPSIFDPSKNRKITKAPTWAKRQKLVLELRFYNVKMILFRPFLIAAAGLGDAATPEIRSATSKCVNAAKSTIELTHDIYCHHVFFRTWWYNTTYVLYAVSIALCYGMKVASPAERPEYLELGNKAVEILDAMEESTVARNASKTIKQILLSANDIPDERINEENNEDFLHQRQRVEDNGMPQFAQFTDDSLMSFLNLDDNLDFLAMTFPLNSSHFPIWSDGGGFD